MDLGICILHPQQVRGTVASGWTGISCVETVRPYHFQIQSFPGKPSWLYLTVFQMGTPKKAPERLARRTGVDVKSQGENMALGQRSRVCHLSLRASCAWTVAVQ